MPTVLDIEVESRLLVSAILNVIRFRNQLQMASMNHDALALATALGAHLDIQPDDDSRYDLEEFRFKDNRLKYVLRVQPNMGAVFLAANPEQPIQGCPMLEYSLPCSNIVIGESAYSDSIPNEIAIRFYDVEISQLTQRLTMTWIPDGYWYIWANAITRQFPENGG